MDLSDYTREQKLNFLRSGEKILGEKYAFARYSELYDLNEVSNELLDKLVIELEDLWK